MKKIVTGSTIFIVLLWLGFVLTEFVFFFPLTYMNLDTDNETTFLKGKNTINVVFTGDIMMGDMGTKTLSSFGFDFPFIYTNHIISEADFSVGNLEGPLTEICAKNPQKKWSYQVNPASAQALKRAGFDAVTLANNHIRDCGDDGIAATIRSLDKSGLYHFGAGENYSKANRPLIRNISGVKIAFFGYLAPYIYVEGKKFSYYRYSVTKKQSGGAYGTLANIRRDFFRYRKNFDIGILVLHVGGRYIKRLKSEHVKWINSALDIGFNAAVCHGTHLAGPLGNHRGKPIFYGLGNFSFASYNPLATFGLIGILGIDKENKKIISAEGIPIYTNNLNPLIALHPIPLKWFQRWRFNRNLKKNSRKFHAVFNKKSGHMILSMKSSRVLPPGYNMRRHFKR
ncbi:MAG: CapA family protein [Deltaproteobacteria bacterium]|nr:CapA family protein [Deltaproteobacteria bacterium]